ncbi:hypothetical protein PAMP_016877 [Pampus punctatissimus]
MRQNTLFIIRTGRQITWVKEEPESESKDDLILRENTNISADSSREKHRRRSQSFSIQAGSIHPALNLNKHRRQHRSSAGTRGESTRRSDGSDSGVLPAADAAARRGSDGREHPETRMLLDDVRGGGREAEGPE